MHSNPNLESMNPSSLQTPISLDFTESLHGVNSPSSSETSDFYPAVLKYLNDILMEDDLQDKTCMLQDCLALQAAEKSFYDLLNDPFDQNSTPTSSIPDQFEFEYSLPHSSSADFAAENDRVSEEEEEAIRSKKRYSISNPESEQLNIFDNSFLRKIENNESIPCPLHDDFKNSESKKLEQNQHSKAPNFQSRRLMTRNGKSKEMIDLSTRLMLCSQAVSNGDQRTADEQLKLIRQNASPIGNGNQRSAHYFANALEARLLGSRSRMLLPEASSNAADILKAYQLYVSVCPFRKITNFYTNRTIGKVTVKAKCIHIIDFGISYGFQWPCFLYGVSTRSVGPPKIRITGIDFPQPGSKPAERVEETGRRLKRLADIFKVPFEYKAIATRWETIQYHDLEINKDEMVFVCCMNRLKNLPDDTILVNKSSRDAVLELIKEINPTIFFHGVCNGSFNAPFFTTRFREAFYHYSAFFDMFEANSTRKDPQRLVFEREMIGRDVLNVIACEGIERFERPETYRQWQSRNLRIGFQQLPLNQDLMKRVFREIKNDYHKDFVIDEDGHWLLMGWRGRIIHAISAWKAIQD